MISKKEVFELVKAWLAISLAFGIIIFSSKKDIVFSIIASVIIVGLSFVIHELAHRFVAKKFKKHAEFRANNSMLLVAIITSFFGIIIAAPGAVHISGFVSRKESGMIASAGPLANIIIGILCIPLLFIMPTMAFFGLYLNALLAVFNLIPLQGFDGQKVLNWNKLIYITLIIVSLLLLLTWDIFPRFITF